ncbi:MAG: SH3 domain-containing protein [Synechococcus sp.]
MNQPPRTRSMPRHSAPRPRIPWVGLTIWGLIAGIALGVGLQAYRWMQPMLDNPPLPPFLADNPLVLPTPLPEDSASTDLDDESESTAESETVAETEPATEPEPPATSSESAPDGDRGRVVEPIGLAIRAEPNVESAYLGGVAFNETVTVLGVSGDGRWQRVRRDLNGQEGWVKAGNLTEIE